MQNHVIFSEKQRLSMAMVKRFQDHKTLPFNNASTNPIVLERLVEWARDKNLYGYDKIVVVAGKKLC